MTWKRLNQKRAKPGRKANLERLGFGNTEKESVPMEEIRKQGSMLARHRLETNIRRSSGQGKANERPGTKRP